MTPKSKMDIPIHSWTNQTLNYYANLHFNTLKANDALLLQTNLPISRGFNAELTNLRDINSSTHRPQPLSMCKFNMNAFQ